VREKIKALLFDVQGTATDFHSTVPRGPSNHRRRRGLAKIRQSLAR